MRRILSLFCTVTVATAALAAPSNAAKPVADLYKDQTVTVLVGYGAGGTYGQTSQLLARHFDSTIPGNPTIVVQYMPGAGGLKMANYAYNVMPKTGLYFLMPPELAVVSQLLRPEKVKYDASKFTWIGRVFGTNQVMVVRRDLGAGSLEDLTKQEVIVASSGTGSPTYLIPSVANAMLGTQFKIVTGYSGMAKSSLSMEMKETFGLSGPWSFWKANRGPWFEGGDKSFAMPLFQVGNSKEPDLPDVPLLVALAKSPDDKAAASLLSTGPVLGRGFAFPPGVPADLVEEFRTAFWQTVNDPVFKEDVQKRKLPWSPMSGADIQKVVNDVLEISPAVVAKVRTQVFGK